MSNFSSITSGFVSYLERLFLFIILLVIPDYLFYTQKICFSNLPLTPNKSQGISIGIVLNFKQFRQTCCLYLLLSIKTFHCVPQLSSKCSFIIEIFSICKFTFFSFLFEIGVLISLYFWCPCLKLI